MAKRLDQTATLTVGLPGSGKTTWAKTQVEHAKNRGQVVIRVNNDDIREELAGGPNFTWSPKFEDGVRKVRIARIDQAIRDGYDVIVDNTHINPRTLNALKQWFKTTHPHVTVVVKDFTDVPLETCIERDEARKARGERFVGVDVIMKMAREGDLIPVIPPYPIDWNLPWCLICDLDGTLALFGKRRNAYDASKCDLVDEPNLSVLNTIRTYYAAGDLATPEISKCFFFSGRSDAFQPPTERFLQNKCGFIVNGDPFFDLVMRKAGDNRHDEIVKAEMFDAHIRGKYNVHVVIDDRPKVVRMWKSLGLPVFNVGDNVEF